MNRIYPLAIAGIGIVLALGGWYLYERTSTPNLLPIAENDTIESWDFAGAYSGNPTLGAQARAEIERLSRLRPTPEIPQYQIYVGIAAQYELLGDGKQAYAYLNRAAEIDPIHTGLAWANLGELMERLGAFNTGRIAYAKAVEAQSAVMAYHIARLEFLTAHFSEDTGAVEGAFSEAEAQFGEMAAILQIKGQWLSSIGKTREAIAVWQKVRALVTPTMRPVIDQEIQRLQKKL